ncbi:hypothetical protein E4U42_007217 [Claviceps africana]|uniref:Uncharacterized protein n=1 Tax=Claviceps africana TaxID=83212 RepID=A0A8K0J201_9HYPO|nr:hypothetical protein E4U42_007217 [Claviceps africana]
MSYYKASPTAESDQFIHYIDMPCKDKPEQGYRHCSNFEQIVSDECKHLGPFNGPTNEDGYERA